MPDKSFLFNQEPNWVENRQDLKQRLAEPVQSWTYEPGSLTQRLRSYYGNAVAVNILHQRWHSPYLSERRLLGIPEQRFCLIREVLLHANGKPLLLARTVIPEATIKVAHRNLSHLGNRPLGEVIFSYPKLERLTMELTLIAPSTWRSSVLKEAQIKQPVPGRRTVYAIEYKQMLVSEFFLPEVLAIF
ncbi:MAG: chorismate lyase [Methylococcales bacterium]